METKETIAYKKKFKGVDHCSSCPKRVPCASFDSICELIEPCSVCPVGPTGTDNCEALCEQMQAYLARGQTRYDIPMSTVESRIRLNNDSDAESVITYKYLKDKEADKSISGPIYTLQDIPWPAISDKAGKIVLEHFKNGKTYEEIATKFNIHHKTVYEIIHGSKDTNGALVTLQEYANYRKLFTQNKDKLPTDLQEIIQLYYNEYKSIDSIAEQKQLDRSTISRRLKKAKNLLDKMHITPVTPI